MAEKAPRRRRRTESTEALILDAAERLFARHGIEGVSLRQIGLAAGSANNFGVQYHFGNKARLVRAIFERRLPALDARRAELLAEAERAGALEDPRTLLAVILTPLAEAADSQGRLSYAAFLLGLRYFEGEANPRLAIDDLAPLTRRLADRLRRTTLGHVPAALYATRVMRAYSVFMDALVEWDRERAAGRRPLLGRDEIVAEGLDVALACLFAPVSPTVAAAVEKRS